MNGKHIKSSKICFHSFFKIHTFLIFPAKIISKKKIVTKSKLEIMSFDFAKSSSKDKIENLLKGFQVWLKPIDDLSPNDGKDKK